MNFSNAALIGSKSFPARPMNIGGELPVALSRSSGENRARNSGVATSSAA